MTPALNDKLTEEDVSRNNVTSDLTSELENAKCRAATALRHPLPGGKPRHPRHLC